MLKCEYCEFSQMKSGKLHCPCSGCQMSKAEIEELNGLIRSNESVDRIRLKAIKEFVSCAEKLVSQISNPLTLEKLEIARCLSKILNDAKAEMVGEEDVVKSRND